LRQVSLEWFAFWDSEFIRKMVNLERKERKSKFVIFYVSVVFSNLVFIFWSPKQGKPARRARCFSYDLRLIYLHFLLYKSTPIQINLNVLKSLTFVPKKFYI
jgi:hypothetical protein